MPDLLTWLGVKASDTQAQQRVDRPGRTAGRYVETRNSHRRDGDPASGRKRLRTGSPQTPQHGEPRGDEERR